MKKLILVIVLLSCSISFGQNRTPADSVRGKAFALEINTAFENLRYLKLNSVEQKKMMIEMRKMNMDAAKALPMVVMQSRLRRLENDSLRFAIMQLGEKQDKLLKYANEARDKAVVAERENEINDSMYNKIIFGALALQLCIFIMSWIQNRQLKKLRLV